MMRMDLTPCGIGWLTTHQLPKGLKTGDFRVITWGSAHDGDYHDLGSGWPDAHVEVDSREHEGRNDEGQLCKVLERLAPRVKQPRCWHLDQVGGRLCWVGPWEVVGGLCMKR